MTPRAALAGAAALLAGCSGLSTQDFVAWFAVGPADVARALIERFPDVLSPDDATWPDDAPAVDLDLAVVRRAAVPDLSGAPFAGRTLQVQTGTLALGGPDVALESLELEVGADSATDETDASVRPVARGEVPQAQTIESLVFEQDGRVDLADALLGRLPEQQHVAACALFVHCHAPVHLTPGGALPSLTDPVQTDLVVTLGLEYRP